MSFRTKPGSNVDRMVAANAAYAAAEGNAYSIIKTQQVSTWHEKQYHKTGGPTWIIGDKQNTEAASELKMANQSVHELRRARMREQIASENLKYEAELNARGLTVAKHRM
mmetsp:Transcript_45389/g.72849  ORF Transcript_45389/g.72849 Transcript_45389/m.72849 type:complete len:110 (+) Transcript_45389:100-429(+)